MAVGLLYPPPPALTPPAFPLPCLLTCSILQLTLSIADPSADVLTQPSCGFSRVMLFIPRYQTQASLAGKSFGFLPLPWAGACPRALIFAFQQLSCTGHCSCFGSVHQWKRESPTRMWRFRGFHVLARLCNGCYTQPLHP